jgi:hypothetical protein
MVKKEVKKKIDFYKLAENVKKDFEKRKEYARNLKDIKTLERRERYAKSTSGRIGQRFSKIFGVARRGITQSLYDRGRTYEERTGGIKSPTKSGGGRGRPKGTVKYRDPRTGQPIGVYEYRKIQSQLRWKERQQIMERSVTNPRQRETLNAIRARDEARMQSPERRTFPDTTGNIPTMRTIHSEINRYANLVD